MWNLVPIKEQNKLKIIDTLLGTSEPITMDKLAKSTGSSVRSIKYYVQELKDTVKEVGGEMITSTNGVELNLPTNIGIDHFQRKIFHETSAFILLEKILFDETLTSKEMEEELFISSSSLSRLVKRIQASVEKYGIQLETGPYRMVGDELLCPQILQIVFY